MGIRADGGVGRTVGGVGAAKPRKFIHAALTGPWDSVLGEESLKALVFVEEAIFGTSYGRKVLLEAENFLL